MASDGRTLRRSSSNSRTNLLPRVDLRTLMNGSPCFDPRAGRGLRFGSLRAWERKALGFSRRFASGVGIKWSRRRWKKKNKNKKDGDNNGMEEEEEGSWRIGLSGCLAFYGKGGGCRVGSCEELEIDQRRSPSSAEGEETRAPSRASEGNEMECFPHGVSEMLFPKMSSRKGKESERRPRSRAGAALFPLPDDVLEMCLVRLPLASLAAARLVCKKWNSVTTSSNFMRMRSEGSYRTPWLFLFGITHGGARTAGEIYALDVCLDRWHRIASPAIRDRFLFSVASVGDDIYVVGGCSSANRHGPAAGRSSLKTHKGVFLFSPLTGSWVKAAPMKYARSGAVLGTFEVGPGCAFLHSQPGSSRQETRQRSSRVRGVSDVYEDPHRCSVRRQLGDAYVPGGKDDNTMSNKRSNGKPGKGGEKRHVLIAVGGHGCWDEPLDSGEIYDPLTNRWTQIAKLPGDFGAVCSGAACGGVFYIYSEADKLACYDLSKGFWVVIQTSRIPPRLREYQPKLVSCNDRLFVLSVSWSDMDVQPNRREKAVRKLWELDPALHSWTEASRHPDAPMDWGAAFVANGNNIYGVELFKIFGQVLDFITLCNVSDKELKWSRITRKHAAHEADVASCMVKAVAVLQL